MGLATSQIRLLSLTSRKADVEMQMQLNSKRKTMLTREATELSKLYYARLQNSKIQYSTTNGYKDVTYDYLMAPNDENGTFFDEIVNASTSIDRKTSDSMILTDAYGRVILNGTLLDVVVNVLNKDGSPDGSGQTNADGTLIKPRTVETLTIDAMEQLLSKYSGQGSGAAADMYSQFKKLYEGTFLGGTTEAPNQDFASVGMNIIKYLMRNGYSSGGSIWTDGTDYFSSSKMTADTKLGALTQGSFYTVRDKNNSYVTDTAGSMYWPGGSTESGAAKNFVTVLKAPVAKQLCQMFSYYGSIFSAAFNGQKTFDNGTVGDKTDDYTVQFFNVAATLTKDANGKYARADNGNTAYTKISNGDTLQAGLKSGIYQLVNVSSTSTGGITKAQGLDYFETQNYVVEKTDTSERETITAWYNAARADLDEKESYWDSEITSLSSELNTITTEIDSVKKLREDAISSTFKWGSA